MPSMLGLYLGIGASRGMQILPVVTAAGGGLLPQDSCPLYPTHINTAN